MSTITVKEKDCQLKSLLCCPCDLHSELETSEQGNIQCNHKECNLNNRNFTTISGQPVLINFDDSVFNKEDYFLKEDGSVLNRKPSRLHKLISTILWGTNKKCQVNVKEFIKHLLAKNSKPTVLIVGGGSIGKGSDALYSNSDIHIISFDVYCSEVTDFIADAHSIPIKNESIDGIWIQAVLEHVLEPTKVVSEIFRVLKPDGIVYADTPFMQQVHEKAYDFTRFSESGHRWLFKDFELIESGVVSGPGTALSWALRYFFVGLLRNKLLGTGLASLFFWLRYIDNFIPTTYSSDGASAVFFMGRKSNKPITPHEIIKFHRGVT